MILFNRSTLICINKNITENQLDIIYKIIYTFLVKGINKNNKNQLKF